MPRSKKRYNFNCEVCEKPFVALRKDAKTCSDKCRRRKSERKRVGGQLTPDQKEELQSLQEVAEKIRNGYRTLSEILLSIEKEGNTGSIEWQQNFEKQLGLLDLWDKTFTRLKRLGEQPNPLQS